MEMVSTALPLRSDTQGDLQARYKDESSKDSPFAFPAGREESKPRVHPGGGGAIPNYPLLPSPSPPRPTNSEWSKRELKAALTLWKILKERLSIFKGKTNTTLVTLALIMCLHNYTDIHA